MDVHGEPDLNETDATWMDRLAREVEEARGPFAPGRVIVCESGISPSGPIHLGNFREVFTVHLVAEALRRRGHEVVHLHSWDDYDRLRKVPAGIDPAFVEHIGKPLSAVPDPYGERDSWASHFIAEFTDSLAAVGVEMHSVRQSERYPAGTYNASIRRAMEQRELVFDTITAVETPGRNARPLGERRREYYPFKPYCQECGKDTTTVRSYESDVLRYSCICGFEADMSLADGARISGKLVWKADWPMRWAYEQVAFEPAGEDHHAPAGSFNIGAQLIKQLCDAPPPHSAVYSFVSLAGGGGKMSGSAGGAAIPATALDVLEPAMLRWLYARRQPGQSFAIDLKPQAVQRLYDEWDRFAEKAAGADGTAADRATLDVCRRTSSGAVATSPRAVSFRLLASAADLTQGNRTQIARLVGQHLGQAEPTPSTDDLIESLEPRLTCAINFATRLLAPEDRTHVNVAFDSGIWSGLEPSTRHAVHLLAGRLEGSWTVDELTGLVYSIPKLQLGLPADAAPTPELKKAQREFFTVLYRLLCGSETGPRLPTLFLSIGSARTRELLVGDTVDPGPATLG
jgi:lysyl-tRNA synthetase class 1